MRLARVIGKVWATAKDENLKSLKISLIQPVDEHDAPLGSALAAVDPLSSRDGDPVYWVSGPEATVPVDGKRIPSDVTIVGLVDRLDISRK
ncbi:MAG: EutN/CcmL family microcompartment protein [Bacteroidetes bacterium]|nr:EutN/CcmL family microcompartment protein [Bacteroidota bacterium]